MLIRPEEKRDWRTVENLTREAFWNVYMAGCDEHFILHRFRTDPAFIPELALVVEVNNWIIAHIMYCPRTDSLRQRRAETSDSLWASQRIA